MHPQSTFRAAYRSDTLWGLLCWGIRIVYGKDRLEEYLDSCLQNKPEFIISSAFPFEQKNGEKTCFFPRPVLPPFQQEKTSGNSSKKDEAFSIKDRKKLKKVSLLPQDFFLRLLRGEVSGQQLRNEIIGIKDQYAVPQLGKIHVTHNTIDRRLGGTFKPEGKAGLLFHTEDRYVLPDHESDNDGNDPMEVSAGLFFLLSYDQKAEYNFLNPVFALFSDIGMGGDRSIGKGFFDFESQEAL
ncbi:MAG: RAMP superfamily CRISPR-associated protein [Bacteroidota bacterium]